MTSPNNVLSGKLEVEDLEDFPPQVLTELLQWFPRHTVIQHKIISMFVHVTVRLVRLRWGKREVLSTRAALSILWSTPFQVKLTTSYPGIVI